jgi:hypothetical protein
MSNAAPPSQPSACWTCVAVGRRSRQHDQIDFGGGNARVGERRAGRVGRQRGRRLIVTGDIALGDSRALADPFVAGVDLLRQLFVADDPLGQRRA